MQSQPLAPPIPAWLCTRPAVGGLVVPWVTPQTEDGRYLLGTIDVDRQQHALLQRRCGVCARRLDDRMVLLARLSDLPHRCTVEPALHPQCAAYTINACPMVSGRLTHYRSAPRSLDDNMIGGPDVAARQGAQAEQWFSVWLRSYDVVTQHGNLAASYAETGALRIRPISEDRLQSSLARGEVDR